MEIDEKSGDRPATAVACFDLGGVLVKICHTWNEAAERAGVVTPRLTETRGLNDCPALISYQAGELSEEAFCESVGDWLGVSPKDAMAVHKAVLKSDYPGARDLILQLKASSVWTCCFSNTNALHWSVLTDAAKHPAIAELDALFASHGHQASKPAVEAFRKIEALFPPAHDRVVFFDDTLENIYGAAQAGWTAFRLDPSGDPPGEARSILLNLGLVGLPPQRG